VGLYGLFFIKSKERWKHVTRYLVLLGGAVLGSDSIVPFAMMEGCESGLVQLEWTRVTDDDCSENGLQRGLQRV